jgi:hypothetical protein
MLSPAEVVLAFGVGADGGATDAGVAGRSLVVSEAESRCAMRRYRAT